MSQDYGSTSGYGIKIGEYDKQKMFDVLSKSDKVKDYLSENNLEMNIDNYETILEGYDIGFGWTGHLAAFLETLIDLKIANQQFSLETDEETGEGYLLYIPDTFPEKPVKKEDIDAIFYKIMDMVDMNEKIDFRHVRWFD